VTNTGVGKEQLLVFIERIERLTEEKQSFADDIKDVYKEAHGSGFDKTALKAVIKIRAADKDKLDEHQAILETYCAALGMKSYML
jgi:uncharacterized protein (UPF0335 family)